MTNKQYSAIQYIITKLKTIPAIRFVGEFPDDISKIGQRFPAIIIEDGNESYELKPGMVYWNTLEIALTLYIHLGNTKTKMQDTYILQQSVNDMVLADLQLGGYARNIKLTEIDKDITTNDAGVQLAKFVMRYQIDLSHLSHEFVLGAI